MLIFLFPCLEFDTSGDQTCQIGLQESRRSPSGKSFYQEARSRLVLSLGHQQGTLLSSSISSSVTLKTTPRTRSLFLQRKRLRFSDSQGNQAWVFTVWFQSLFHHSGSLVPNPSQIQSPAGPFLNFLNSGATTLSPSSLLY